MGQSRPSKGHIYTRHVSLHRKNREILNYYVLPCAIRISNIIHSFSLTSVVFLSTWFRNQYDLYFAIKEETIFKTRKACLNKRSNVHINIVARSPNP